MTILDALKGLYAKLGGKKSPDNIQTIGEALEDITAVAGEGGGGGLTPHIHISRDGSTYTAVSDVPFADLIADWDSENWKFSTYDLVYVTDNYGIAVKCEVVNDAIVATCLYPDTSGGTGLQMRASRYTWNGTTVTFDEFE